MAVSGSGLLITAGIDLFKTRFLVVAIVLYLIALVLALGFVVPATGKLIRMVRAMPAAPSGPPPAAFLSLINQVRANGVVLQVLFLTIIFLMIIKPGGITAGPLFG